jgi:hypothetical protein
MQSIGEYLRHIINQIRDKRNREKVFNMAAVKKSVSLLISEPLLKKHVENGNTKISLPSSDTSKTKYNTD